MKNQGKTLAALLVAMMSLFVAPTATAVDPCDSGLSTVLPANDALVTLDRAASATNAEDVAYKFVAPAIDPMDVLTDAPTALYIYVDPTDTDSQPTEARWTVYAVGPDCGIDPVSPIASGILGVDPNVPVFIFPQHTQEDDLVDYRIHIVADNPLPQASDLPSEPGDVPGFVEGLPGYVEDHGTLQGTITFKVRGEALF